MPANAGIVPTVPDIANPATTERLEKYILSILILSCQSVGSMSTCLNAYPVGGRASRFESGLLLEMRGGVGTLLGLRCIVSCSNAYRRLMQLQHKNIKIASDDSQNPRLWREDRLFHKDRVSACFWETDGHWHVMSFVLMLLLIS
jgi:hypothetical protein